MEMKNKNIVKFTLHIKVLWINPKLMTKLMK